MIIFDKLNQHSIRKKLFLFLGFFLGTTLFLATQIISNEKDALNQIEETQRIFHISYSIADLITELQKERGLTEGYFHQQQGGNNISRLKAQWTITDQAIKNFNQTLAPHVNADIEPYDIDEHIMLNTLLERVNANRQKGLTRQKNLFAEYTKIIKQSIVILRYHNTEIRDNNLKHLGEAFILLTQLQEQSGRERGLLNGILSSNKITAQKIRYLAATAVKQQIYKESFRHALQESHQLVFEEKLNHPIIVKVDSIREDVLSRIERHELLNQVQQMIGYGGLIHLFQNYIIRGNDKYRVQFNDLWKSIPSIINGFLALDSTSERDKQLFATIISTFHQYADMIEKVKLLKSQNVAIKSIDQVVKVNDERALDAIKKLRAKITSQPIDNWWQLATQKLEQYINMRALIIVEIEKQLQYSIKQAEKRFYTYLFLAICIILLAILTGYLLLKRLVFDIRGIAEDMQKMTSGHKQDIILSTEGNDEITQMSHAFNNLFKEKTKFEDRLKSSLEDAQAGTQAKSQFLSTMSHEIRTPLNGIIGMAELLSHTSLTNEQTDYSKTISQSGELLLSLINDILDFSKLEARSVQLEEVSCDLEKLSVDILNLLSNNARSKKIDLLFDYPVDSHHYFSCDPMRLRQVLLNLINNAIKFTHQGHVLLTIKQKLSENNRYQLQFSIKDTGIGIEETELTRLFESFTQAEQSTTRKFGGTGLGLAISKQLVELMGGKIQVESTPGKGSHFFFSITLSSTDTRLVRGNTKLQEKHILIVNNNPIELAIQDRILQHYNINTTRLNKSSATLKVIQKAHQSGINFDLVILNQHFTDMDGIEIAKKIRNKPPFNTMKLVLLMCTGKRGDAEKAFKAGFSAYHTKPLCSTTLIQSIEKVLTQEDTASDSQIITNRVVEHNEVTQRHDFNHHYKANILLAEDNLVNQKVAKTILNKLALSVDVANDGIEAVKMVQEKAYDLIFMDCLMPNMDGFEATKAIRQLEQEPEHITIIALTANALEEDKKRCFDVGMDDFIAKPFKLDDITSILDRWLKTN